MTAYGRRARASHRTDVAPPREGAGLRRVWALARILLGLVFLWAFFDKLLGLGFSTPPERAWVNGGSPTRGFLAGVEGPFAGAFKAIAGNVAIDWLFMLGLLGVGLALVLGIGMRIAAIAGALMLALMWLASLPIATNPFIDDHVIYAVVLIGLAIARAGDTWGLGRWWRSRVAHDRARWLE